MDTTIKLSSEFIKLDGLLKTAQVVDSGGEAKQLIQANQVRVNGEPVTQRGRKIRPGDVVEVDGDPAARILVT